MNDSHPSFNHRPHQHVEIHTFHRGKMALASTTFFPFPRQLKSHTGILQQHRVTSDRSLEGAGVALGKNSSCQTRALAGSTLSAALESEACGRSWWGASAGTKHSSQHWDYWDSFLLLQLRWCWHGLASGGKGDCGFGAQMI